MFCGCHQFLKAAQLLNPNWWLYWTTDGGIPYPNIIELKRVISASHKRANNRRQFPHDQHVYTMQHPQSCFTIFTWFQWDINWKLNPINWVRTNSEHIWSQSDVKWRGNPFNQLPEWVRFFKLTNTLEMLYRFNGMKKHWLSN